MSTEPEKGVLLIALARAAIGESFDLEFDVDRNAHYLQNQAATFVTLKLRGQLRGCIGTLQAYRPLGEDVYENARAAAFRDPRFAPLNADEFDLHLTGCCVNAEITGSNSCDRSTGKRIAVRTSPSSSSSAHRHRIAQISTRAPLCSSSSYGTIVG